MSTEERLAALEAAFEEVKKLKGIPGPRGGAGDISAATANSERVVKEALADLSGTVEGIVQRAVKTILVAERAAVLETLTRDLQDMIPTATHNKVQELVNEYFDSPALENKVIETLRDFGVVKP